MRKYLLVLLVVAAFAAPVLAVAPSPERLYLVLNAALNGDPVRKNTTTLGTTIDDALDTDLTAAEKARGDASTQMIVVTNLDTSGRVCLGSVAWSSTTDCVTLCGTAGSWTGQGYAATMNCTAGNASMGSVVPPGQSRAFYYTANRCVCMVASEASTEVQVERFLR